VLPGLEQQPGTVRYGLPLAAGKTFRLVIDQEARDADGDPLARAYDKTLHVVAADRSSPSARAWRITAPQHNMAPLVVDFDETLDQALALRWIELVTSAHVAVPGDVELARHETRWVFTPRARWVPGDYIIIVNPALEDLAGNTFSSLFDVDVTAAERNATDHSEPIRLNLKIQFGDNP